MVGFAAARCYGLIKLASGRSNRGVEVDIVNTNWQQLAIRFLAVLPAAVRRLRPRRMVVAVSLEGVGGSLLAGALWDLLKAAVSKARSSPPGWESRFVAEACASSGTKLDRDQQERLANWVTAWPLEALDGTGVSAAIVKGLLDEVFLLHDHELCPRGVQLDVWKEACQDQAERLAQGIWPALLSALDGPSRVDLINLVGVQHANERLVAIVSMLSGDSGTSDDELIISEYPLERARLRPAPGRDLSIQELTWARNGVVEFIDRGGWLDGLETWCVDPSERIATAVIDGAGGMGKTRLALELCRRMGQRGWIAGLYQPHADGLNALAREPMPRLVVLDYAESNRDSVKRLLEVFSQRLPSRTDPVRLVFVVRRDAIGTVSTLNVGHQSRGNGLLLSAHRITLSEFDRDGSTAVDFDRAARKHLYGRARHAFDRILRGHETDSRFRADSTTTAVERTSSWPIETLNLERRKSPLAVLLQAVLDSEGNAEGRSHSDNQVIEHILHREDELFWRESQPPAELKAMAEWRCCAVAIATLFSPDSEKGATSILGLVEPWQDSSALRATTSSWLSGLYPGRSYINPLEPDRIGEALVARYLDKLLPAALDLWSSEYDPTTQRAKERSLLVAGRLTATCARQIGAAIEGSIDLLVTRAIQAEEQMAQRGESFSSRQAARLATLLQSCPLREPPDSVSAAKLGAGGTLLAAAVEQQRLVHHRARTSSEDPANHLPALATSLSNLSNFLGDAGRNDEALEAIGEAISIRRELARIDRDGYLPNLANSLNSLSGRLGDDGRYQEALDACMEATAAYRDLVKIDRTQYVPGLAMSLNNLSNFLGEAGRQEEAIEALDEATNLYTDLAKQQPSKYRDDLAMCLNNRSLRFDELGRHEEALAVAVEAFRIYRDLAKDNPAKYLADLAMSLHNLSVAYCHCAERGAEALDAITQATDIYRDLVNEDPRRYLADYASSLNTLSNCLADVGKHEESLDVIIEATDVYRRLAQGRPTKYLFDLAMTLNNLSVQLRFAGRDEDAVEAVNEAVELFRELAEERYSCLPHLAGALQNYSDCLRDNRRDQDALKATTEAADIYRTIAATDATLFVDDLVYTLQAMVELVNAALDKCPEDGELLELRNIIESELELIAQPIAK